MAIPTKLPEVDTFRDMNRAMALVLLEECFDKAGDVDANFATKMELLKLNVKLGDLEPKQVLMPSGSGFSVQIVLSSGAPAPVAKEKVVEHTPEYLSESPLTSFIANLMAPPNDNADLHSPSVG